MLMVRITDEIRRPMTIDEVCLRYISVDGHYTTELQMAAKKRLDEIGFVELNECYDKYENGMCLLGAVFRHVTERPATHNERRAYYYLKCVGMRECDGSCVTCPLSTHCISYTSLRDECIKIMDGKEFFEA